MTLTGLLVLHVGACVSLLAFLVLHIGARVSLLAFLVLHVGARVSLLVFLVLHVGARGSLLASLLRVGLTLLLTLETKYANPTPNPSRTITLAPTLNLAL